MIDVEQIWKKIHDPLKTFVLQKVKNVAEAEDIVQETFMKMSLNIDQLENPSKITSWIFQIARNTINDYFRNRNKLANNHVNNVEKLELAEIDDEELKTILQTQEFSAYAAFVINQLPEKYREAVYLTDIKGISQKELAKKLNISVSGAKSRVQRGRQKVKELVLQCCDVNADVYGNIVDFTPRKQNCSKNC